MKAVRFRFPRPAGNSGEFHFDPAKFVRTHEKRKKKKKEKSSLLSHSPSKNRERVSKKGLEKGSEKTKADAARAAGAGERAARTPDGARRSRGRWPGRSGPERAAAAAGCSGGPSSRHPRAAPAARPALPGPASPRPPPRARRTTRGLRSGHQPRVRPRGARSARVRPNPAPAPAAEKDAPGGRRLNSRGSGSPTAPQRSREKPRGCSL